MLVSITRSHTYRPLEIDLPAVLKTREYGERRLEGSHLFKFTTSLKFFILFLICTCVCVCLCVHWHANADVHGDQRRPLDSWGELAGGCDPSNLGTEN